MILILRKATRYRIYTDPVVAIVIDRNRVRLKSLSSPVPDLGVHSWLPGHGRSRASSCVSPSNRATFLASHSLHTSTQSKLLDDQATEHSDLSTCRLENSDLHPRGRLGNRNVDSWIKAGWASKGLIMLCSDKRAWSQIGYEGNTA